MNDGQGDREGRPYNTNLPVLHVNMYCTGDPRGRPGSHIVFMAIIHKPCLDVVYGFDIVSRFDLIFKRAVNISRFCWKGAGAGQSRLKRYRFGDAVVWRVCSVPFLI